MFDLPPCQLKLRAVMMDTFEWIDFVHIVDGFADSAIRLVGIFSTAAWQDPNPDLGRQRLRAKCA
jgi:hypothetical protein